MLFQKYYDFIFCAVICSPSPSLSNDPPHTHADKRQVYSEAGFRLTQSFEYKQSVAQCMLSPDCNSQVEVEKMTFFFFYLEFTKISISISEKNISSSTGLIMVHKKTLEGVVLVYSQLILLHVETFIFY